MKGSNIPLNGFQNQPAGLTGALNGLPRQGVELTGVNQAIELRLDPSFAMENWISEAQPDIVLIELHWYIHTHGAREAARLAKQATKGVPVLLGGLTASSFPEEILRTWPDVDMVLAGEAELPLAELGSQLLQKGLEPDLIPNLWRRQGKKIVGPRERWVASSLAELDHVDMSWLQHVEEFERSDFRYRNRWLLVGRGCPKSCFFCGGSKPGLASVWGRNCVTVRSPSEVARDVVRLARSGVEAVHLTHDLLSLGKEYWEPFFGRVARIGISVGLGNESWGPLPDEEFLDAWVSTFDVSKSYIALSPTSAWSGLRSFASRGKEDECLLETLEKLARRRFPLHIFFLLNIPGETAITVQKTIDMAWAVMNSYPPELLRLETQAARIDPSSPAALGMTKKFRFVPPSLTDYLAVSSGGSVPSLIWPEEKDSIGKRYRRQDAIGTPFCITIDHQSLEDDTVTGGLSPYRSHFNPGPHAPAYSYPSRNRPLARTNP